MRFAIVILALLAVAPGPRVRAQQYKIDGWPIKKSWGPVRGAYFDPARGLCLVFEDAAGTVRVAQVNPENGTAVPIGSEITRQ